MSSLGCWIGWRRHQELKFSSLSGRGWTIVLAVRMVEERKRNKKKKFPMTFGERKRVLEIPDQDGMFYKQIKIL